MGQVVDMADISDYHVTELHIRPSLLYRSRKELFGSCSSTYYWHISCRERAPAAQVLS